MPLAGPGSLVMSQVNTCPGPVAISSGRALAGWRARRLRSFTCAFAARIRYIVETEHRYSPRASSTAYTCSGVRSTN